jgi:hypothetical protein
MRYFLPMIFLAGCAPSGIFMLNIPYAAGTTTCTTTVDENFSDGFYPDAEDGSSDSPWTEETEYTGADSIAFVHISPTSGGGAVLTMGDSAFPGVAEGDGWTFTWDQHTSSSDTRTHEDGYTYSESTDNTSSISIHVTQAPFADLAGTISVNSVDIAAWTEKDKWDEADTDFSTGMIPSGDYLYYKDNGDLVQQYNLSDEKDCKDSTCELTVTRTCAGDAESFTAKQVSGEDVLLYNDMYDDGQSAAVSTN